MSGPLHFNGIKTEEVENKEPNIEGVNRRLELDISPFLIQLPLNWHVWSNFYDPQRI